MSVLSSVMRPALQPVLGSVFDASAGAASVSLVLPMAPAENVPIFTASTSAPVFATATEHPLKRIGANTTAVDTANDPKFRYPGIKPDSLTPFAGNNIYVEGQKINPAASDQTSFRTNIEFITSSKFVCLRAHVASANAELQVLVDGRYATEYPFQGGSASNRYFILEFPDARPRRVTLGMSGNGMRPSSVFTESSAPPVRPTVPLKALFVIGDSLTAGAGASAGGTSAFTTWAGPAGSMCGFDVVINAGIGGTGWVTPGSGGKFGDRIANVLLALPSAAAVVFCGSRNDPYGDQAQADQITANVVTAVGEVGSLPCFVMGTLTEIPAANNAVRAGAMQAGAKFIDVSDLLEGKPTIDGVHPTLAASRSIWDESANRLYRAGLRAN